MNFCTLRPKKAATLAPDALRIAAVYGITTGFGVFADVRIDKEQLK